MSSNSSTPFGFGFGARYMLDRIQQFTSEGLPVFLRLQTTDVSDSNYADVGFVVTVSGAMSGQSGFTDYQIIPQPIIELMPTRRYGIPETQLQAGEVKFMISHNWVLGQMQLLGLAHPMLVFRDPRVIGLVFDNEIYSMESITDSHAGGQVVYWEIVASHAEQNVG